MDRTSSPGGRFLTENSHNDELDQTIVWQLGKDLTVIWKRERTFPIARQVAGNPPTCANIQTIAPVSTNLSEYYELCVGWTQFTLHKEGRREQCYLPILRRVYSGRFTPKQYVEGLLLPIYYAYHGSKYVFTEYGECIKNV